MNSDKALNFISISLIFKINEYLFIKLRSEVVKPFIVLNVLSCEVGRNVIVY